MKEIFYETNLLFNVGWRGATMSNNLKELTMEDGIGFERRDNIGRDGGRDRERRTGMVGKENEQGNRKQISV